MRLDVALTQRGFCSSREQAQQLIADSKVQVDGEVIGKNSHFVSPGQKIQLSETLPYVSRGGFKLENALEHTKLKVFNQKVLDVGISTGGFADVLLQRGVREVVGIDVGRGQLADKIKNDFRVKSFEGLHVRDFQKDLRLKDYQKDYFHLVVMDLSFISLKKAIPHVLPSLRRGKNFLCLVKPQFELGPEAVDKKGIVKDDELYLLLKDDVVGFAQAMGLEVVDYFSSGFPGKGGNEEFFLWSVKR